MQFGLDTIPTDESISPAELARAAEAHGFASLIFPEHTHVPVGMRSTYPGASAIRSRSPSRSPASTTCPARLARIAELQRLAAPLGVAPSRSRSGCRSRK